MWIFSPTILTDLNPGAISMNLMERCPMYAYVENEQKQPNTSKYNDNENWGGVVVMQLHIAVFSFFAPRFVLCKGT